ncbi:MAG TPA: PEP/pyruvate-binding domain-containing protein, partial [Pseudomonadota bacterium]|nr:PEP/pyruvate-binding domain-containing protein [Pseudomonadota bacterium]
MAVDSLILHPAEGSHESESFVGGKAAGLLRLHAAGAVVPAWFAVRTEAFLAHLTRAGLSDSGAADSGLMLGQIEGLDLAELERRTAQLRQKIVEAPLDTAISEELRATLPRLGPGPYAVRSSMVGEDSGSHSFAGQLDTYLFQSEEDVPQALLRCWASAFTARAVSYRARSGLATSLPRMGVVVQRMIRGKTSGVMFTRNPLNGRADQILISACWGSGEGVVSGQCSCDEFVGDPTGRELSAKVVDKETQIVHKRDGGPGTEEVAVPDTQRQQRCLSREQVEQLLREGHRLAGALGQPLDIEWTFAEDGL